VAAAAVAALLHAAPVLAQPKVVTSFVPVHSLTAGVMAGIGQPEVLIKGAGNPHTFSMKPSDARMLAEAQLVVWIGPAIETFLEKPVAALGGKARILRLIDAPGLVRLEAREGGAWEGEDAHGHGHAHGKAEADGHIWTDPENAKAMAQAIAAALAEVDSANGARYRANAEALGARLSALDGEIAATLAPVRTVPYIVFHDSFQYFERRYGLAAAGSITVSPDKAPGARRLASIRQKIQRLGARCVFHEPQFNPPVVRTVIDKTAAKPGVLNPEGAGLEPGPDAYFVMMRANAQALRDCLGS